jgi:hypothetical protein
MVFFERPFCVEHAGEFFEWLFAACVWMSFFMWRVWAISLRERSPLVESFPFLQVFHVERRMTEGFPFVADFVV